MPGFAAVPDGRRLAGFLRPSTPAPAKTPTPAPLARPARPATPPKRRAGCPRLRYPMYGRVRYRKLNMGTGLVKDQEGRHVLGGEAGERGAGR
ncbi:hypothetical protein C3Y87_20560 [Carbonactinospora thermoautotrophica]|nr:hypothetical protein [Carbonactinospora thermoautotrophica]